MSHPISTNIRNFSRNTEFLPEHDYHAIEDVEPVADVAYDAFSDHLQDHLQHEQRAEYQVAVFQSVRQFLRLQRDSIHSCA